MINRVGMGSGVQCWKNILQLGKLMIIFDLLVMCSPPRKSMVHNLGSSMMSLPYSNILKPGPKYKEHPKSKTNQLTSSDHIFSGSQRGNHFILSKTSPPVANQKAPQWPLAIDANEHPETSSNPNNSRAVLGRNLPKICTKYHKLNHKKRTSLI